MWWVKLVLIAGRAETVGEMQQMVERRYTADSREPVKTLALKRGVV